GRDGYAEMQKRTGLPLVDSPELAARPEHQAALIAAFWSWKGMNPKADAGDFTAVIKAWNGRTIGKVGREARMAGQDLLIRDLPDVDRIVDETKQLPVPVDVKKPGAASGIGAILAAAAQKLGAPPEVIVGIVIATVAVVAFFVIRHLRQKD